MKLRIIILFLVISGKVFSQGYNHQWLLGYGNWATKGRLLFDSSSYSLQIESRKMKFYGTEATICDTQGNFLMSSNGVWIANANNDTMMNGGGLNPGWDVSGHPDGLLLHNANVILPFPGDSNKFILFHHAFEPNDNSYSGFEIFKTEIDITLDSGLGGVVLKNDSVLTDTINQGFAACKHANGRDWWIVCQKENSDELITFLITPFGIQSISYQALGMPIARFNVTQITFSQVGSKMAYNRYDPLTSDESVILADFDRCTGYFSNAINVPITTGTAVWGLAFSSSGNYAYAASSNYVFQVDVNSLAIDTVAIYDGYYSPYSFCCATTFWNLYLAANGKIYGTTGNGTQHLHEMNYPDSAGIACDFQQHAINLGIWNFRAVPNHPNYYLGPLVGSGCDTLTGLDEHLSEIVNFQIKPNPNNGNFSISYLLPQNKPGWFEVYDVNGRIVYKMPLPQWSTLQQIKLPKLADGIYNTVITSNGLRVSRKIAIINE